MFVMIKISAWANVSGKYFSAATIPSSVDDKEDGP
jgi:hypothetical protein